MCLEFNLPDRGLQSGQTLVAMLCDFGQAIHIVWVATCHFHLNRGVGNAEIMCQFFRYSAQDVLAAAHALLVDHDVTATTNQARADCPDVQIMYCQHAMYAGYRLLNLT